MATNHTPDLTAYVIVTSRQGVRHCADVEETPTTATQPHRESPVPVTHPTWAFGWAADDALDQSEHDGIARDVWLIMGGVVTDHAHITPIGDDC
jgi:hypothetical protein